MKNTICSECGTYQQVPPHYIGREVKCIQCKVSFTAITAEPPKVSPASSKPEHADEEPKEMTGCAWFMILAFVAFVLVLYIWIKDDKKSHGTTYSQSTSFDNDYVEITTEMHGAWAYMQLFVEKRLKSPSSAKFPFDGHRSVESLGGSRYQISSYVDAKNPMGVTIRTHFSGIIKRAGGRWELEYLNMK